MGKIIGVSVTKTFKTNICDYCTYTGGCKRGVYPQYNKEDKELNVKCGSYERRPTDEKYYNLYPGKND